MVKEELEQKVGFLLLEPDNPESESFVDEERLLASHRVYADDGVLSLDRLTADDRPPVSSIVRLVHRRVHGLQTLQAFLEFGREAVVGLDLRREEGVTADLGRLVEDEEEGGGRRLLFVGHVRVPAEAGEAVGAPVVAEAVVLGVAVDDVELWVARDVARGRMAVDRTKVPIEYKFSH